MINVEEVAGPVEPFAMDEMEKTLGIMKNGKAIGTTGVVMKHPAAYSHGKQIMSQIANKILDRKDMPHNWKTNTVVPIYKKKGSVMSGLAIEVLKSVV